MSHQLTWVIGIYVSGVALSSPSLRLWRTRATRRPEVPPNAAKYPAAQAQCQGAISGRRVGTSGDGHGAAPQGVELAIDVPFSSQCRLPLLSPLRPHGNALHWSAMQLIREPFAGGWLEMARLLDNCLTPGKNIGWIALVGRKSTPTDVT